MHAGVLESASQVTSVHLRSRSDLTPIARRDWIGWITSTKQTETRVRRIHNACEMLATGKRRVCWVLRSSGCGVDDALLDGCFASGCSNIGRGVSGTLLAGKGRRRVTPAFRRLFAALGVSSDESTRLRL